MGFLKLQLTSNEKNIPGNTLSTIATDKDKLNY